MQQKNRWKHLVVGVLVLLLAGLIYAWSVMALPIAKEFPSWNKASLSGVFTVCMIFFCFGGVAGGFLLKKMSVRVVLLGAALFLLGGFFLAASAQSLGVLIFGYGLLCGFGSGLAYNGVMSTVTQWYRDRQGLASGILLMGFGFGSFFIGKAFVHFTPAQLGAWRSSFRFLGIVIFLVFSLGALVLQKPPQEDGLAEEGASVYDFPPRAMLRKKSFWIYFLWAAVLSGAGLILISHAAGIARETSLGLSEGTLSTVVGLISIFNGLGRVLFGGMFDRNGRSRTMAMINGLFFIAVGVTLLALWTKSLPLLVVGFIITGIAYGGVTPTNSAFICSYFGPRFFSVNFPLVNLNLLLASFGSSLAGRLYDLSHSYTSSTLAMFAMLVLGTLASLAIGPRPQKG
ncbi:Rod shape-determining protein RodA [Clostridiaceae bacterium JG1575]|nr:Rod shape-determining protein RodA [Clostridiaceae bacterium JG1575]